MKESPGFDLNNASRKQFAELLQMDQTQNFTKALKTTEEFENSGNIKRAQAQKVSNRNV